MNHALYTGEVVHRRRDPIGHAFRYPLGMFLLDLGALEELDQLRLVSRRIWWPFQFRREDYLGGGTTPLSEVVHQRVRALGGSEFDGPVMLLCQLRCFGIYFSPLNLYYCYQADRPRWILAEVSNTPWNERHCYLIDADRPALTPKAFHVSPFMPMEMQYAWYLPPPGEALKVRIGLLRHQRVFDAVLSLRRQPLTDRRLLGRLLRAPWITAGILWRIYWQALRLWCKQVPFFPHPGSRKE